MKKVGNLTFHNAYNYGAALQTYALQKVIISFGLDSEIIDYRSAGVFKRNTLKNIYYFFTLSNPFKRAKLFKDFHQKYLKISKEKYNSINDMKNIADKYDYFILGSDQIWNEKLTNGIDPVYFGKFNNNRSNISYAASVGRNTISEDEKVRLNEYVRYVDHISVREESAINFFENSSVECVLDPTLLLDYTEWNKVESNNLQNEKYILIYGLENNRFLDEIAIKLSDNNTSIKEISPYYRYNKSIIKPVGPIGPREFIEYIHKADIVITDSFHGLVFSILFQKEFYAVPPKNDSVRMTSLLNKLKINRMIFNESDLKKVEKIDYEESMINLRIERENSINFLKKALLLV